MKQLILFTLLSLFILTAVMGPFAIYPADLRIDTVETAWAGHSQIQGESLQKRADRLFEGNVQKMLGHDRDDPNTGLTATLEKRDTAAIKPNPKPKQDVSLNCGFITGKFIDCIAIAVNTVFEFFGLFLGGAGVILDLTVEKTVIQMGANLKSTDAIQKGWETFRDLANIILIFAFLAIGIGTILQLQNYTIGKLLPILIIVALLVNFSLFFTRVIIDGGNLLATRVYQEIQKCDAKECDISDQFMQAVQLTTLYQIDINTGEASLPALNAGNIITIGIMGSLLFLVTTFVFLAAALLLVTRFVMLIFLMVLAPLAFVAMAIPPLKEQASKWWGLLINYTIFAPIYFLLLWFVLELISNFQTSLFSSSSKTNFADIVAESGPGKIDSFGIFLNFIIATAFMIFALFIAKHLGIKGSEAALKAGKGLAGLAVANTAGRFSGALGRGYSRLQERATSTPTGRFARAAVGALTLGLASDAAIRGTFKAGEDAKFGGSTSATQMRDDTRKRKRELGSLGTRRRAQEESKAGAPSAAATVRSLGKEDLESMKTRAIAQPKFAANLSPSQLETIMKSDKLSPTEKQNIRARREEGLLAKVNAGEIDSVLSGSPKDIAKLPPKVLKDTRVIEQLSPAMLGKIIDEVSDADREIIRNHIEFAVNIDTPTKKQTAAAKWFKGPAGSVF